MARMGMVLMALGVMSATLFVGVVLVGRSGAAVTSYCQEAQTKMMAAARGMDAQEGSTELRYRAEAWAHVARVVCEVK